MASCMRRQCGGSRGDRKARGAGRPAYQGGDDGTHDDDPAQRETDGTRAKSTRTASRTDDRLHTRLPFVERAGPDRPQFEPDGCLSGSLLSVLCLREGGERPAFPSANDG